MAAEKDILNYVQKIKKKKSTTQMSKYFSINFQNYN